MYSDVHKNVAQLLLSAGALPEDDLLEKLKECVAAHAAEATRNVAEHVPSTWSRGIVGAMRRYVFDSDLHMPLVLHGAEGAGKTSKRVLSL